MNNQDQVLQDFLNEWPLERVHSMTLEEYTNLNKDDAFTYCLESKTKLLGGIQGGTAHKFGIYKKRDLTNIDSRNGYQDDGEYAWLEKYGKDRESVFKKVKKLIIKTIEASSEGNFHKIDTIDLGKVYKWKIAFLYSDKQISNIFKRYVLESIAEKLGISSKSKTSEIQQAIVKNKPSDEEFFAYTNRLWQEHSIAQKEEAEDEEEYETYEVKPSLNQILYGPPGTGKTYNTINKALEIIDGVVPSDRNVAKTRYDELVNSGQIVFTTFHQSMSYEDFVEGIKPKVINDNISYGTESGVFKKICREAEKFINTSEQVFQKATFDQLIEILREELDESDPNEVEIPMKKASFRITSINESNIKFTKASGGTSHDLVISTLRDIYFGKREFKSGLGTYYHPLIDYLKSKTTENDIDATEKSFVLIIDEINRGNVSSIFGELITLIEESKRIGNEEEIQVILPYSKKSFGVPNNLHIIGTMNTADRSVEALDTALRRRFVFEEMMPNHELLTDKEKETGFNLKTILNTINKRIKVLLDRDHQIGHSYFLKVEDEEDLKLSFAKEIIPLLQEYFYGDYVKIALVLGKGFFEEVEEVPSGLFAEIEDFDTEMYSSQKQYELKNPLEMESDELEEALNLLLNR
ncbi:McrB family protein [Sediminitomix flava]|uniref:5-methylcytosine-specific restriction endonuclease McrBC GTP-binding regulatory subunit McrB n=1 Tax=Sediminitomix flava TaxID=379075 RepID=A0A315Z9K7_SEDFL|nr:AAA family ATPase [Sediminitomix flava]PWJ42246.1 5-methylcytosine-specific restriction endonuclease McrBC GTP-binding regulatory subunit McrB [Sediminitomix flava]